MPASKRSALRLNILHLKIGLNLEIKVVFLPVSQNENNFSCQSWGDHNDLLNQKNFFPEIYPPLDNRGNSIKSIASFERL